jgi:hypothetical protein
MEIKEITLWFEAKRQELAFCVEGIPGIMWFCSDDIRPMCVRAERR